MRQEREDAADFERKLDNDTYHVAARWSAGSRLMQIERHKFLLMPSREKDALDFVCEFAPKEIEVRPPNFDQTRAAAAAHWKHFWTTGGAIDLSRQPGPARRELERRIVLSQYLTAIQCAGSLPAAGDRAHLQQLVRQVPPGDALVARGALRAVGPAAAAGAQPRLVPPHPARGARARRNARGTPARAGPR